VTGAGFFQLVLLGLVLVLTVIPLGRYMAAVYGGGRAPGDRVFAPIERIAFRLPRVDERREQRWNVYAISLLAFSVLAFLLVYALRAPPGLVGAQPDEHAGRPGVRRVQRGRQLHDQHDLAVVLR
jgi:K+-transporting ATPase ATPase A chain